MKLLMVVILMGIVSTSVAAPAKLLRNPVEVTVQPAEKDSLRGMVRKCRAELSLSALDGKEISLNLFPGLEVVADRVEESSATDGSRSWVGRIRGDEMSMVAVTVDRGRVIASVRYGNMRIGFQTIDGNRVMVCESYPKRYLVCGGGVKEGGER